jgi:enoyl-[acyl-carrier protein] reductase II
LIHEVKTVQDIIDETVSQFHAISARMGAMAALQHFG